MSVYSFGFGGFGSLGTGELTNLRTPAEVPDIASLNVTHISVSLWHSLIITDTGRLYSLGRGRYGALGLGDDADIILTKPTRVPAFNDAMKVMDAAAGRFHSLAVTDDGCIWSFGFGVACGHGNTELNAEPQRILNMYRFKVKNVSGGEHHSACVTDEGKVFTWGLSHRVPLQATANGLGEEKVIRVSCGNKHGMILTDSGKLYGYGNNASKQVCSSQPNHVDDARPVQIHSQVQWTEVHAGLSHTMGLSSFNEVYLWGTIGTGCNERDGVLSLYKLQTNLNIKSIFSGYSSFGIRTTDGLLFTWGFNEHGNLGHGHSKNVSTPTLIESIRSVNIGHVFSGGYNIYCMPSQGSTMSSLLNGHFNTDVTISSGTERYPAHKCILASRSKILAERITESSTLDVSDIIPSEELFAALEFLYSNLTSKVPRENRFLDTMTKLGFERVYVNGVNASGDHAVYEQDVQKLITSPQEYHSDVSFKLDDEEELVHAHRCILSCKSEFFNAMFSTGMMESQARTIEFHDARKNVFLTMIHFMYNSDSIQLEVETSVEMLELGVRINWHRLRTTAERLILKHLDKDNVIDMMNVAELCSSASIKTAGIMLMAKNKDIDISSLDQEIISQVEHARKKIQQDVDRQVQIAQNEKQWLKKQEREQVDRERLAYIGTERDTQRVNDILRNRDSSNRCLIQ